MKIMKTIIEKIDKNQKNTDIIREAGRILKEGGLVAFPTETVYGLGADALNEDASAPRPYTVSVGNATRPPSFKIRPASLIISVFF